LKAQMSVNAPVRGEETESLEKEVTSLKEEAASLQKKLSSSESALRAQKKKKTPTRGGNAMSPSEKGQLTKTKNALSTAKATVEDLNQRLSDQVLLPPVCLSLVQVLAVSFIQSCRAGDSDGTVERSARSQ
jgi:cell division septum initiation protein DivIVA